MLLKTKNLFILIICLMVTNKVYTQQTLWHQEKLMKLIDEIKQDAKYLSNVLEKEDLSAKVYEALAKVERHKFVKPEISHNAYNNHPLPIGYGQTISQPFIVALMTDLLQPQTNHKVLEIGTGSGYQAAVLSHLVEKVYSIEIVKELAALAKDRLKNLNYENIEVFEQDGYKGLEQHAPFDSIIVTAAASHIPPALITQLKVGGKIVIPVGNPYQTQNLIVVTKMSNTKNDIKIKNIIPVVFVPFTRK
jgi:protein-L-isoaspartate(D-aspartate) O-methyltransferase